MYAYRSDFVYLFVAFFSCFFAYFLCRHQIINTWYRGEQIEKKSANIDEHQKESITLLNLPNTKWLLTDWNGKQREREIEKDREEVNERDSFIEIQEN